MLLAVLLAAGTTSFFFTVPATDIHVNHESYTYIYRLIDFREALGTGHYSPQWSTYMHGGLGGPYFGYYQPGFFYLASIFPHSLEPVRAIGLSVFVLLVAGFLGMWRLVGARFGSLAGSLAGTFFVLSTYTGTEIWVRGDFAELTAMMLLPLQLLALLWWRNRRSALAFAALGLATGALVISHAPVAFVMLLLVAGYLVLEDVLLAPSLRNAVLDGLPILGGVALAAFYWLPIVLEWDLVQPEMAFIGTYGYSNHFVALRALLGQEGVGFSLIPVGLGLPLLLSLALTAAFAWAQRGSWTEQQRQLARLLVFLALSATFLLLRHSEPLWRLIPMLPKVQFPWRILTILTLALSGLAALWALGAGRLKTAGAGLLLVLLVWRYPQVAPLLETFPVPGQPADLARMNYHPDRENEWVPRGARTFPVLPREALAYPEDPYRNLATSAADCRANGLERGQSRLVVQVTAPSGCRVTLPQYYFPVGWTATLGDERLHIENDAGRIALSLPDGAEGQVVLTFGHTPARRSGLWVSLVTLLALVIAVAAAASRRPRTSR